jgi:hypothetical protein
MTHIHDGVRKAYDEGVTKQRLSLMMQDAYPITVQRLNGLIDKINELEDRIEELEQIRGKI